ncbi:isochorismate synthase MenF [Klenkia sp. PcliD-1-E]|uniref:isochorismate synthase n=1 Tax=Klenkia sp. PcliD-1-E TaxID=2954492 RepID=UPI002097173F|nr:isochorismate synthase [Klenkia sp. PcliD-1-E]MCO7222206.1 isochorismate synthase [Klenkia sp. PcliD-1-E]
MSSPATTTQRVVTTPLGRRRSDLLTKLPAEGALAWVRDGEGLVGWGEVDRFEVTGPGALERAAEWWAQRCAATDVVDPVGRPGSGAVVFGSVAFDPERGRSVFVVPAVVLGRRDGETWVTVAGGDHPEVTEFPAQAADASIGRLVYADGALDPVTWCGRVAEAVHRIAAGDLQKVVLARDVLVRADHPLDPRRLLLRLAARFPSCWTYAVEGLLGATPELLLRRTGDEVSSRVLAGTAARSSDAAADTALGAGLAGSAKDHAEHRYAVESLATALRPHCRDLDVPSRPSVLTLPNVRHLSTDVRGHLAPGAPGLLELLAAVHPTAAVGGTPREAAMELIREVEGMDRDRYAGPVGWLDSRGDGEFGLALRCAQLTGGAGGAEARLFAGCGIVGDSDPMAELAETQAKLAAVQAALQD